MTQKMTRRQRAIIAVINGKIQSSSIYISLYAVRYALTSGSYVTELVFKKTKVEGNGKEN